MLGGFPQSRDFRFRHNRFFGRSKALEPAFADTGHQLGQRQTAVADRRMEVIQCVAVWLPQILCQNRQQLLARDRHVHSAACVLDLRLALCNILRPALLFEPRTDLRTRLAGFHDIQPVAVRPLVFVLAGDDLADLTGVQLIGKLYDLAVDLSADHAVSDLSVNMICKINDGRTDGQTDRIALRRHDNNVLRGKIVLDRVHKLFGIGTLLLCFEHLPDPRDTGIQNGLSLNPLLVFPVRGNTVFRIGVHFPCPDLHLERDALLAKHGGMQRLIAVRLRIRDIILEAVRDRAEHIVNQTEHAVAFIVGRDNDTHCVFIVDLSNVLVIDIYFFIDAVDALDTAVDLRRRDKILVAEALCDAGFDAFDERFALLFIVVEQLFDILIGIRVKVIERKIFQLFLHGSDAEAVRDRRIDIHRLKCRVVLLVCRTELQRPHIVQTVGQLDDHDADILRHGKQDLHDILRLLLLLAEGRDFGELCHTVHEHRNIMSKTLFYIVQRGGGILDNIMQKRRTERIGIHTEFQKDIGNGHRMDDVRLARRTHLPLMTLCRKLVCGNQLADVILTVIGQNLRDDHVYGIGFIAEFRHRAISFLQSVGAAYSLLPASFSSF